MLIWDLEDCCQTRLFLRDRKTIMEINPPKMDRSHLRLVSSESDMRFRHVYNIKLPIPFDSTSRNKTTAMTRSILKDIDADISDLKIIEGTYNLNVLFKQTCDVGNFRTAWTFSAKKIAYNEKKTIMADFVSISRSENENTGTINSGEAVLQAFEIAARKSNVDISLESYSAIVQVRSQSLSDYLGFWKSVPRPLRKTLYWANDLSKS